MQVQAYKEAKALSQSSLKLLDYDPKSFYYNEERWLKGEIASKPEFKVTESMKLGEVVDCLLLTPLAFDSNFIINTAVSPSGQMLTFADEYIRLESIATEGYTKTIEKEIVQQIAQSAYESAGFKRDSFAKVLDRFKEEALPYYNVFRKGAGKTVITAEMYKHAQELIKALKEDQYIKHYLCESTVGQTVYNQMELYHNFGGTPLKGLLDRVIIDHDKKTVQAIDLKTTSEDFFPSSIISYRYDMQAAFYTFLLQQWCQDNRITNYIMLPFLFITVNTISSKAVTWQLSNNDLYVGEWGGKTYYGKEVKGWRQLLDAYRWHKANSWDYPRDVLENEGKRITNCFVNEHD